MTRDERGAATVAVLAAAAVVLAVGAAVAVVMAYAAAQHRARGVADLAAVAGAGAYASGQACATATRVAGDNGARVTSCTATGDAVEHVVAVGVEIGLARPWPGLPNAVRGTASAGRVA